MNIISTIIPIFTVIILGWFARWKGFIPPEFLAPANRLVYYLAIPAMIFHSIAKASLKTQFDSTVLTVTLLAVIAVFAFAWGVGLTRRIERKQMGTFMQCSFHGNLGYIGLAVAYYYLGSEGLVRASIIAGFIMILQNFLAVVALQLHAANIELKKNIREVVLRILGNPVIISALAGILCSLAGLRLPLVLDRSLAILSGLALPMALLIIGASLSFEVMQLQLLRVLSTSVMKLILLPGLGLIFYRSCGLALQDYLPGLILLAAPSATLTYVMAKEMNGDTDFAVAAISISTMLSAITFSIWLTLAG
jgi:predicted permease